MTGDLIKGGNLDVETDTHREDAADTGRVPLTRQGMPEATRR